MRRASSLPVLQFCGKSDQLGPAAGPSARAAAISSAYHAQQAGAPDAKALLAALTPEEREELGDWGAVIPLELWGQVLRYEDAAREVPTAFSAGGAPLPYSVPPHPRTMVQGTADMVWIVTLHGERWAVVGDIKKTRWTTSGPGSLQLAAYGFGFAGGQDCVGYLPAIYIATEQRWQVGDPVRLESEEGVATWDAVVAAASNRGEFAPGPHCSNCHARFGCPAFLMPRELQGTPMDPLTREDATEVDWLRGLLYYQQQQTAAEAFMVQAKEWARRNGGITDPDSGRTWMPHEMPGRRAFDSKAALTDDPSLARYMKAGASYFQFRWGKSR